MATKVQCLRCPASVHSTNATWQTSFGVTQLHSFIFSAVSDSPHREALFSGRFLNGQWATLSFLKSREDFVPNSRYKAVLHLRDEDELFVLVNAHEQCIEPVGTGDVTADDEILAAGARRGTCTVGGKVAAEAGAVTCGAVRCSA